VKLAGKTSTARWRTSADSPIAEPEPLTAYRPLKSLLCYKKKKISLQETKAAYKSVSLSTARDHVSNGGTPATERFYK
jgi:hypothetical protein